MTKSIKLEGIYHEIENPKTVNQDENHVLGGEYWYE